MHVPFSRACNVVKGSATFLSYSVVSRETTTSYDRFFISRNQFTVGNFLSNPVICHETHTAKPDQSVLHEECLYGEKASQGMDVENAKNKAKVQLLKHFQFHHMFVLSRPVHVGAHDTNVLKCHLGWSGWVKS